MQLEPIISTYFTRDGMSTESGTSIKYENKTVSTRITADPHAILEGIVTIKIQMGDQECLLGEYHTFLAEIFYDQLHALGKSRTATKTAKLQRLVSTLNSANNALKALFFFKENEPPESTTHPPPPPTPMEPPPKPDVTDDL